MNQPRSDANLYRARIIRLDFLRFGTDMSSNTPAPPLPLVGDAHLERVFWPLRSLWDEMRRDFEAHNARNPSKKIAPDIIVMTIGM